MSRLVAEMMPTVTLPPRPKGLPMAMTQSPTRMAEELPKDTALRGSLGSTFRSARSVLGSWPRILVTFSLEPSTKLTMISSAPSMT